MGRPPGPPEEVRRNRVVVMVRDGDLAGLRRLAARRGVPVATMVYEAVQALLRRSK